MLGVSYQDDGESSSSLAVKHWGGRSSIMDHERCTLADTNAKSCSKAHSLHCNMFNNEFNLYFAILKMLC